MPNSPPHIAQNAQVSTTPTISTLELVAPTRDKHSLPTLPRNMPDLIAPVIHKYRSVIESCMKLQDKAEKLTQRLNLKDYAKTKIIGSYVHEGIQHHKSINVEAAQIELLKQEKDILEKEFNTKWAEIGSLENEIKTFCEDYDNERTAITTACGFGDSSPLITLNYLEPLVDHLIQCRIVFGRYKKSAKTWWPLFIQYRIDKRRMEEAVRDGCAVEVKTPTSTHSIKAADSFAHQRATRGREMELRSILASSSKEKGVKFPTGKRSLSVTIQTPQALLDKRQQTTNNGWSQTPINTSKNRSHSAPPKPQTPSNPQNQNSGGRGRGRSRGGRSRGRSGGRGRGRGPYPRSPSPGPRRGRGRGRGRGQNRGRGGRGQRGRQ